MDDKNKADKPTEGKPADKINWDSKNQRRLFEKMGLRIKVNKPDDKK